jgi:hypothetical protein
MPRPKKKIGPLIFADCAWARCIYISCVHLLAFTSSNQVECKYLNAKFKHCFGTNVAASAAVPPRGFAETSYCVLRPQAWGGRHHLPNWRIVSYAIMNAVCTGNTPQVKPRVYLRRGTLLKQWKIAMKVIERGIPCKGERIVTAELLRSRLFSSLINNRNDFVVCSWISMLN